MKFLWIFTLSVFFAISVTRANILQGYSANDDDQISLIQREDGIREMYLNRRSEIPVLKASVNISNPSQIVDEESAIFALFSDCLSKSDSWLRSKMYSRKWRGLNKELEMDGKIRDEEDETYSVINSWEIGSSIPNEVLSIGLNGGSLSNHYLSQNPNSRITTVEFDDRIINQANDYFRTQNHQTKSDSSNRNPELNIGFNLNQGQMEYYREIESRHSIISALELDEFLRVNESIAVDPRSSDWMDPFGLGYGYDMIWMDIYDNPERTNKNGRSPRNHGVESHGDEEDYEEGDIMVRTTVVTRSGASTQFTSVSSRSISNVLGRLKDKGVVIFRDFTKSETGKKIVGFFKNVFGSVKDFVRTKFEGIKNKYVIYKKDAKSLTCRGITNLIKKWKNLESFANFSFNLLNCEKL